MEIADKPCYPQHETIILLAKKEHFNGKLGDYMGLTFRERLIIALAGNPAIFTEDPETIAENLVYQADAIIKQLEGDN